MLFPRGFFSVVILSLLIPCLLWSAGSAGASPPRADAGRSALLTRPFPSNTRGDVAFTSLVRQYFRARRFSDLEALAGSVRRKTSLLISDARRLETFHEAFDAEEGRKAEADVALAVQWVRAYPKSATARAALVSLYTNFAWEARGSGWAKDVSQKGWKLFGQRLKEAARVAGEALELTPPDPHLYVRMITLCNGMGIERNQMETIFRKGQSLAPLYYPLYNRKLYYLAPRWHGSVQERVAFVRQSVEGTRSKLGTAMNGLMGRDILRTEAGGATGKTPAREVLRQNGVDWVQVQKGYADLMDRTPNVRYPYLYALLIAEVKDQGAAARLLPRLKQKRDADGDVDGWFAWFEKWATSSGRR